MTYTPIAKGTTNWDVPLNAALAQLDANITTASGDALQAANNLSDLTNTIQARNNLGLSSTSTAAGSGVYNVKDYGAIGNGVADDTVAINNTLTAAYTVPGSIAYIPPGTYKISAPLTIPPQTALYGSRGSHLDAITCEIVPAASFSGAAAILMVDQVTGGYPVASNEQRIKGLTLEGSNLPGTTIDGIQAQGFVHGVMIEDVQIRDFPNHGIATVSNGSGSPYSWRVTRVLVNNCSGYGISAGMTDCTWIDVQCIGNGKSGWFMTSSANSHYTNCRAEWNGFDGFTLSGTTGSGNGSGGSTFTACSTDRNNFSGFSISLTGPAPIIFNGVMARRDGRSSTSSGHAGFKISANTAPIIVNGVTCFTGVNDDGTGLATPQYGFSITGTSSNVTLVSGFIQGISASINDDASNTWFKNPNVISATGPTGSQVISATSDWNSTGKGTLKETSDLTILSLTNTTTNTNNAMISAASAGATGSFIKSEVSGDSNFRFSQTVDGTMQWGPGSATRDTTLYRASANILQSDDNFSSNRSATTDVAFSAIISGDAFDRHRIYADGKHEWGSGAVAGDTNIYRESAGVLKTDQSFSVAGQALGIARPASHSAVAWTYDPANLTSGKAGVAGTVYLAALYVNKATTVTKLFWGINTAGASITAGQNFVGLYNSTGARLTTVGVDARVTTTGLFTETISVAVTPGLYWVAFVFNATTMPQVYRAQDLNATLLNFGITSAASYRFATNGTGQTSLPTSITPSSNAAAQFSYWAAIA